MFIIDNNSFKNSIEQVPFQDLLQQANKTVEDLFQKTVLTEEDTKKLIESIQSLSEKLKQNATEETHSTSCALMVDTMVKAKEVITKHQDKFNQADQDLIQNIYSKSLIIKGQKVEIDPYRWANSLKELAPIFIGDLANTDLHNKEKPQLFVKQYPALTAYLENKTLPDTPIQLFNLFKVADLAGYKELQKVVCKKILATNNPIKDELLEYAFNSDNNALVIKCLPEVIKNKSTAQIIEIIQKVDKKLPKEWLFTIKDGTARGKILQAQYEVGAITLEGLMKTLEKVLDDAMPQGGYSGIIINFVLNENRRGVRENALNLILNYKPCHYEFFKMASQIKVIKNISFRSSWEVDEKLKEISFPNVEKVYLSMMFNQEPDIDLIDLGRLFPNAKQYVVCPVDDQAAANTFSKIPEDITHLHFDAFDKRQGVTDATAQVIASKFKNLQDLTGWNEKTKITDQGFIHIIKNASEVLYKKGRELMWWKTLAGSSPYWNY